MVLEKGCGHAGVPGEKLAPGRPIQVLEHQLSPSVGALGGAGEKLAPGRPIRVLEHQLPQCGARRYPGSARGARACKGAF